MSNITLNFENQTIVLANKFSQRAAVVGSAEYTQLLEVKKEYPTFSVCVKPKQVSALTKKHGNMKYDDMVARIMSVENEEKREALMLEFNTLRAGGVYFTVRAWYINTVLSIDIPNSEENAAQN